MEIIVPFEEFYPTVAKMIDYAASKGFVVKDKYKNLLQKFRDNDLTTKPGDDPYQDDELILGSTGLGFYALEWLSKHVAPEGHMYLDHEGTLMLVTEQEAETYYSGTALI